MIIAIEECEKCKHYKGMDESFVRCNHIEEFNVMVISRPSFYNEGFNNGDKIVLCPKDKI